jgi:hypothetical protein
MHLARELFQIKWTSLHFLHANMSPRTLIHILRRAGSGFGVVKPNAIVRPYAFCRPYAQVAAASTETPVPELSVKFTADKYSHLKRNPYFSQVRKNYFDEMWTAQ